MFRSTLEFKVRSLYGLISVGWRRPLNPTVCGPSTNTQVNYRSNVVVDCDVSIWIYNQQLRTTTGLQLRSRHPVLSTPAAVTNHRQSTMSIWRSRLIPAFHLPQVLGLNLCHSFLLLMWHDLILVAHRLQPRSLIFRSNDSCTLLPHFFVLLFTLGLCRSFNVPLWFQLSSGFLSFTVLPHNSLLSLTLCIP